MKKEKRILDIMLDVETLSTANNPVLTQLSAVSFRIEDGIPLDEFNKFINPQSCVKVGLTCSDGFIGLNKPECTMDFWLNQPSEVFKKVILKAFLEGEDLPVVLEAFTAWVKETMEKNNCTHVKVYGNGPAADCVWVRSAYDACQLNPPWQYWDDACVRTYVDMEERIYNASTKRNMTFKGEKHNAIDDCKHQIAYVCEIFKKQKASAQAEITLEDENTDLKNAFYTQQDVIAALKKELKDLKKKKK